MSIPTPSLAPAGDLLQSVVRALGAYGAAFWLRDRDQLSLKAVAGRTPSDSTASEQILAKRQASIRQVIREGRPQLIRLQNEANEDLGSFVFAPIVRQDELGGIVEIFLPPGRNAEESSRAVQVAQEQFVALDWNASEALSTPAMPAAVPLLPNGAQPQTVATAPAATSRLPDWAAVMKWLLHIQSRSRVKEIAQAAANEGRTLFAADRVSIALKRGRKTKIAAVSGQQDIHPRAQLVKALGDLAKLVMQTGVPLRVPEELDQMSPELEAPLSELVHVGGAQCLVVVPLQGPKPEGNPSEPKSRAAREKDDQEIIGAMIVEQFEHMESTPELQAHLDLVTDHLGATLKTAQDYESIFLLPVWRATGTAWKWLRKHQIVTLAVLAALVAVTIGLIYVPWDYRVEGTGRLMPRLQRDVFAPWDGYVAELTVHSGDRVKAGDVLMKLQNNEMRTEQVRVRNEYNTKRKQVNTLLSQWDAAEKAADRVESTRLQGKITESEVEISGLRDQLATLDERLERMTVKAPIDGVVTTFQVEQLLMNRPVARGDVLVQVMDDRDAWQLELEVAEHRMGHLRKARATLGEERPIEYRLLTKPDATYQARLTTVGTRVVNSEDAGSIVEVRADLDSPQQADLAIGAEVRARISCGPKPLGYVLFGDVIEFVQKYLWW